MIPILEFVDCTPGQIGARIEKMMHGCVAQRVVIRTLAEESVVGVYEGVDATEVLVEIDEQTQQLVRVPLSEVAMFGQYVPPLDPSDDLRVGAW